LGYTGDETPRIAAHIFRPEQPPVPFRPTDVFWRWGGKLDRGPYAVVGVLLFALKHNIDRFVAIWAFHRPWSLFYYISPSDAARITELSAEDARFYSALLGIAIPFIYVGTLMTVKRLRSARLPAWLVTLFFVPVVNLVFFAVLSVLPSVPEGEQQPHSGRAKVFLHRLIPDHPVGAAAMALLLTIPLFIGGVFLSVYVLGAYGWSLFVGLPFCLGLYAVLIYGYHAPRNVGSCIGVALLATLLFGVALVALAVEGVICVAMAAPLMAVLATLGAVIGYVVQRRPWSMAHAPTTMLVLVLAIPALMGAEYQSPPAPPLVAVRTSVDIDAPPERVWQHVVAFTELPPPEELYFKTGIAYPMRAEISGRGPGAVRHCVFSTGAFVEPIEVWDEPHLLKFSVSAQPPAMQEMTPYGHIDPPHLDNYLVSEGGQFLLTPLEGGRTRLEGTTWYRNKMWPSEYWQLWSDWIIHRIHTRVLEHVKRLAEAG
jgi:uncharacterized membrane protein YhaH (DUF805 family)